MASLYMNQVSYQQHQEHQQQQQMHHHQLQQQQQHHYLDDNVKMQLQQQQQQQQHPFGGNSGSRHQAIAPATSKILGNSNLHNIQQQAAAAGLGPMVPRKKYTYANMPYGEQLPSVARRNARERNRVKQVNNGFTNLRQHLPQTVINALSHGGRGESKKLSKVDTLRIAVEYIRGLQDLLCDSPGAAMAGDESSNDGSNFGYSSVDSPIEMQQYQMSHSCHSDVSASPTPSYSDSDISIGGANYFQLVKQESQLQHATQGKLIKFEQFEDYSPLGSDEQPDDEELLDYISSWQEQ